MRHGRFAPQPLSRYVASIEEALDRVRHSGFYQWDDLDYFSEQYHGEEFFSTRGTIQCAGEIRVAVMETLKFARETSWSPRGSSRRLSLIT